MPAGDPLGYLPSDVQATLLGVTMAGMGNMLPLAGPVGNALGASLANALRGIEQNRVQQQVAPPQVSLRSQQQIDAEFADATLGEINQIRAMAKSGQLPPEYGKQEVMNALLRREQRLQRLGK